MFKLTDQSKLISGGSSSALGFWPGAVTIGAVLAPPKGLACKSDTRNLAHSEKAKVSLTTTSDRNLIHIAYSLVDVILQARTAAIGFCAGIINYGVSDSLHATLDSGDMSNTIKYAC